MARRCTQLNYAIGGAAICYGLSLSNAVHARDCAHDGKRVAAATQAASAANLTAADIDFEFSSVDGIYSSASIEIAK